MSNARFTLAFVLGAALAGATFLAGCGSDDDGGTAPVTGPTWSGALAQNGGSFQRTFTESGTWSYRCTLHGGMTGTITVDPAVSNPESLVVSAENPPAFNPAATTVRTGGYVRWVNNSNLTHNTVR